MDTDKTTENLKDGMKAYSEVLAKYNSACEEREGIDLIIGAISREMSAARTSLNDAYDAMLKSYNVTNGKIPDHAV